MLGAAGAGFGVGTPGGGELGGLEEGLDFGLDEGLDVGVGGSGGFDGLDDVLGCISFGDGPAPEAGEGGVFVADGFGGGEFGFAGGDASGCELCGLELMEVGAGLVYGDGGQGGIGGQGGGESA